MNFLVFLKITSTLPKVQLERENLLFMVHFSAPTLSKVLRALSQLK